MQFTISMFRVIHISKAISELCDKAIKAFRLIFFVASTCLILVNVSSSDAPYFIVPMYFNYFGNPYLLFATNVAHYYLLVLIVISIELLPIISVLKLGGLVAVLCDQLKELNSTNLDENERNLDECIELHSNIIR